VSEATVVVVCQRLMQTMQEQAAQTETVKTFSALFSTLADQFDAPGDRHNTPLEMVAFVCLGIVPQLPSVASNVREAMMAVLHTLLNGLFQSPSRETREGEREGEGEGETQAITLHADSREVLTACMPGLVAALLSISDGESEGKEYSARSMLTKLMAASPSAFFASVFKGLNSPTGRVSAAKTIVEQKPSLFLQRRQKERERAAEMAEMRKVIAADMPSERNLPVGEPTIEEMVRKAQVLEAQKKKEEDLARFRESVKDLVGDASSIEQGYLPPAVTAPPPIPSVPSGPTVPKPPVQERERETDAQTSSADADSLLFSLSGSILHPDSQQVLDGLAVSLPTLSRLVQSAYTPQRTQALSLASVVTTTARTGGYGSRSSDVLDSVTTSVLIPTVQSSASASTQGRIHNARFLIGALPDPALPLQCLLLSQLSLSALSSKGPEKRVQYPTPVPPSHPAPLSLLQALLCNQVQQAPMLSLCQAEPELYARLSAVAGSIDTDTVKGPDSDHTRHWVVEAVRDRLDSLSAFLSRSVQAKQDRQAGPGDTQTLQISESVVSELAWLLRSASLLLSQRVPTHESLVLTVLGLVGTLLEVISDGSVGDDTPAGASLSLSLCRDAALALSVCRGVVPTLSTVEQGERDTQSESSLLVVSQGVLQSLVSLSIQHMGRSLSLPSPIVLQTCCMSVGALYPLLDPSARDSLAAEALPTLLKHVKREREEEDGGERLAPCMEALLLCATLYRDTVTSDALDAMLYVSQWERDLALTLSGAPAVASPHAHYKEVPSALETSALLSLVRSLMNRGAEGAELTDLAALPPVLLQPILLGMPIHQALSMPAPLSLCPILAQRYIVENEATLVEQGLPLTLLPLMRDSLSLSLPHVAESSHITVPPMSGRYAPLVAAVPPRETGGTPEECAQSDTVTLGLLCVALIGLQSSTSRVSVSARSYAVDALALIFAVANQALEDSDTLIVTFERIASATVDSISSITVDPSAPSTGFPSVTLCNTTYTPVGCIQLLGASMRTCGWCVPDHLLSSCLSLLLASPVVDVRAEAWSLYLSECIVVKGRDALAATAGLEVEREYKVISAIVSALDAMVCNGRAPARRMPFVVAAARYLLRCSEAQGGMAIVMRCGGDMDLYTALAAKEL
ncbi:hypothetical protein KIPB_000288, partial [Kipferlia bialata]